MKNVSNKSAIQDFLKQRPQVKASKPKFDVGDVIINTKFKVISKIIEIKGVFDNEDRTANYDVAQYVMCDIKNDARDKFMAERGGVLTPQDSRGMQRDYKRHKYCQAIDVTYTKINPAAAYTLYGVRVNEGDDDV
jgi:hypothetical protein